MSQNGQRAAIAPRLNADLLAVLVSAALVLLVKAGLLPAIGW